MEVKVITGPIKSSVNVILNACNVVKGDTLKSFRIKTNSSFTLVQKRHLAFLFFIITNKPVILRGEVNIFGGGTEVR